MSTKKKILVWIPFVLVLCYIIFKCWALFYYITPNYNNDYSSTELGEITIKTDKSLANTKFKNMNFYLPDGLVENKKLDFYDDGYSYYVNKEDVDFERHVKSFTLFDGVIDCVHFYNNEDRIKDASKIMKENNFQNKYDVYKYFVDNADKKVNLFSSFKDIKLNYYVKTCGGSAMIQDNYDSFFVNGDILGFYSKTKRTDTTQRSYTLDVFDKESGNYYFISFYEYLDLYEEHVGEEKYKEMFTKDTIDKILSSIYFD